MNLKMRITGWNISAAPQSSIRNSIITHLACNKYCAFYCTSLYCTNICTNCEALVTTCLLFLSKQSRVNMSVIRWIAAILAALINPPLTASFPNECALVTFNALQSDI